MKHLISMALFGLSVGAAQASGPVVAELFTSQGCSSCPPADKVLSELAERDDVLALSLPVTYWDHLGWDDTFARKEHAPRQRAYAGRLENGRVYTPQLIVNGRHSLIGSRRDAVRKTVDAEARSQGRVEVAAERSGDMVTVRAVARPDLRRADVVLVAYRPGPAMADVKRGENAGRKLHYTNVVTDMRRLGRIGGGETAAFDIDAPARDAAGPLSYAVIVQDGPEGAIEGAAKIS